MGARLAFNMAKVGNATTFRRLADGETIPDITLSSVAITRDVFDWAVIENYTDGDVPGSLLSYQLAGEQ